jgi:FkbM family methyltransferase
MARLRTAAGTGHATRRVRGNDATVLRDVAAEVRVWRVAQRAAGDNCRPAAKGDWLELLKSLCFRPATIVDIGANTGDWSRMARRLFPSAQLVLVDGNNNTRHWSDLGGARSAVAILDREERTAQWFTHAGPDTGASLLKEQTAMFATTGGTERRTETLDGLLRRLHGGEPPAGACDLLKLDVQGAELRVLQGAARCLAQAEAVLLELSVAGTFNAGAASFAEHVTHLDKAGFSLFDVGEQHRLSDKGLTKDGILFQLDLLFVRKGGRFTRQAQTAIERFGAHSRGVAPVDDELALVRSRRSVSQID